MKKTIRRFATSKELRAYRLHEASQNFHTIGTHFDAHVDEAVAIMFLKKTFYGNKMFPGIVNAAIIQGFDDKGLSATEWAKKGVLLVGIGEKNPFNEHTTLENAGFSEECATTLVAKYLEIDRLPFTQQVMHYALFTDLNGDAGFEYNTPNNLAACPNRFLPGSLLKNFYRVMKPSPEVKAVRFGNCIEDFYAVYLYDYYFHTKGKDEYAKGKIVWEGTAKLSERELARRRKKDPKAPAEDAFKVFFVRSESDYVLSYALYVDKKIGLIVCRQKSGLFQIHQNNRYQINLAEVTGVLRRMHQDATRNVVTTDFRDLKSPGEVAGAEEIYFDEEKTGGIFNGSLTHPDVAPSPLTDSAIIFAIKAGLGKEFPAEYARACQSGVCPHKNGQYCKWYKYGLQRCINTRKVMYHC